MFVLDIKDILSTYLADASRAGIAYEIATAKRLEDEKCLERYGFKVYSQNDEDGIIEEIFNRIGTTNKKFVEFGVENGLECNSHYLLHKGWSGLWIEGNPQSVAEINARFYPAIRNNQLKCRQAFITKDNINQLIAEGGQVGAIDLLSVDIDGNDYYVWQAINVIKPRAVIVEYNAKFPPNHAWKQAYNANHQWDKSDWQGVSLKALELLGRKLGYQLVGTNLTGVNAFFVRRDLAADHFLEPATSETLFNPMRYFRHISGHPARFYLGNQLPNIGELNYNPQEYEKQLEKRRQNLPRPQQFMDRLNARINETGIEANGMKYRPSKAKSVFFLPLVKTDLIQQFILMEDNYFESKMLQRICFDSIGGLIAKRIGEEGSVVVDIGANIGNHTLYFANELNAGKVISFEPVPNTFKILETNIQLNGLQDRVEIYNQGLSDKPGRAEIEVFNPGNIGGTSLKAGKGELILTTLDSLNLQSVTFIKMDVEGMEPQALKGAVETIKRTRPIMLIESFEDKFPLVEEFFSTLDYRHEELEDHNYLFYPAELDNWHDPEVENYDVVIHVEAEQADFLLKALPSIEKYLGHERIVLLGAADVLDKIDGFDVDKKIEPQSFDVSMMTYALDCQKDYYLFWSANELPLRAVYFTDRQRNNFLYQNLNAALIKTDAMRDLIEKVGGLERIIGQQFSAVRTYYNYLARTQPELCAVKNVKTINLSDVFGRALTDEELALLPYDVAIK